MKKSTTWVYKYIKLVIIDGVKFVKIDEKTEVGEGGMKIEIGNVAINSYISRRNDDNNRK